jgi:hypothetical protein
MSVFSIAGSTSAKGASCVALIAFRQEADGVGSSSVSLQAATAMSSADTARTRRMAREARRTSLSRMGDKGRLSDRLSRYFEQNPKVGAGVAVGFCLALAAGVVALGLIAGGSSSPGDERTRGVSTAADEDSLEYKLAVIHKGGYVSKDDDLVRTYRGALTRAAAACPEGREQVSDMAVKVTQVLGEKGTQVTALEALEAIPTAVPTEMRGTMPCSEVLALWAVLVEQGGSP